MSEQGETPTEGQRLLAGLQLAAGQEWFRRVEDVLAYLVTLVEGPRT